MFCRILKDLILYHSEGLSNITYVSANLNSLNQLKEVCKGADALFLLTATAPHQVEYEINIIDAAR
ncbi:hypothetical protein [Chryseobacterium sp. SIMBA_029]|uniref:hypothetical protein n=1 Tax=Chryseobacterium sp. SIMBA_029 TaxID=3085772 RepID=UPI0039787BDF